MSTISRTARTWTDLFEQYAADLFPGRYNYDKVLDLVGQAYEIERLAKEKDSTILIHNYLPAEFYELTRLFDPNLYMVGDSLGLSLRVRDQGAKRVDFESVYFMAATAKIIAGDATRVFTPDRPEVLGCSLVLGTDYDWILNWKAEHPNGIMITYINSDAYLKSLCDYVCTSANTDLIIAHAVRQNPGAPILVLPDKYLGRVMKIRALKILASEGQTVDESLIHVYDEAFNNENACCYVHEKIGHDAAIVALLENPGAELMIHPECGCSATCLTDLELGKIDPEKAFFLSTEGMAKHARSSKATKFIVATEKNMVYRLRRENADLGKEFIPINDGAVCKYMQGNNFSKTLRSLNEDRLEIIICDDCCDPRNPVVTDSVVHIQRSIADKAKLGIERMLQIF